MDKIRIGFDTRDLFLARTGIRTVLIELLKELESMERIEIIRLQPRELRKPSSKFQKIVEHIWHLIWKQIQLPLKAKKLNCHALVCNDYVVPLFRYGINTYPIFHGINIWQHPENYNRWWLKYFTFFAIRGAKRAAGVLTVSEFTRQELIRKFRFHEKKIHVIHNGPKRISPLEESDILIRLGLEGKNFLLFVGVFEKRKNIPNLIKAFSELKGPEYLVLAGQRISKVGIDDYPNILEVVEKFNLKDRVLLPGHVTDSELAVLYQAANLFIFPSIYEGFGIPILEAYQFNVPVVCSNLTAIPEVVGPNGVYFDPKDPEDIAAKIQSVLDQESLRLQLVENGRNRLELFNWRKSAEKLVHLISNDIASV